MPAHEYAFTTRWHVAATCEEVFAILEQPEDLPRWWGQVYLGVVNLTPARSEGIGRRIALTTRGWLPYTLRWTLEVTGVQVPHRIAFRATGDFDGGGVWTLTPAPGGVDVRLDWQVVAQKPLLRRCSFLLKPLFAANHHWAMARGLEGLRRELDRRRAAGTR